MAGFKFPDPKKRSENHPAVLCDGEKILGLYNQATGNNAARVSKKVQTWFRDEAHNKGWTGIGYLPGDKTTDGYTAILWVPTSNTPTVLVIEDGSGSM